MKKYLFLIVFLMVPFCTSIAQVKTSYYDEGSFIMTGSSAIQSIANANPTTIELSSELVSKKMNSYKKEDLEDPNRFGIPFDINNSLEDGNWVETEYGRIWAMTFKSANAHSLTFVFNDLKLADGAEMYVTNKDQTIVFGPVSMENNPKNGFLMTDDIPGSESTIFLYEPNDIKGESSFIINSVIYGIKDLSENSQGPNRSYLNPACYSKWDDSANGVGIVRHGDGTYNGSGSLMMATDYSFKPYFLLSYKQIKNKISSIPNWSFKFCARDSCNGTIVNKYTYYNPQLLAYWEDSNFALLELESSSSLQPDLIWLGWDRSTSTPSSGVSIFNKGGALKIAFRNSSLSSGTCSHVSTGVWSFTPWDLGDFGTDSYGAPFLNQSKRVVGNYIDTDLVNVPGIGWLYYYHFNKFYNSWSGNGSNTTRLSNWLDPIGSGQTTMNSYHPVGNVSIIGNSRLGDTNVYYVQNLPNNMTVEWSLSDSYYSQNQMFQNAPSSNQCTIIRNSSHEMIGATLTATIKENNVVKQRLNKTVTLYNNLYGTYYNGVTTKNLNTSSPLYVKRNANLSFQSQNFVGATVTHEGDATVSSFSFNSSTGTANFYLSSLGTCLVRAIFDGVQYALPFIVTDNLNQLNLVIGDGQIEASLMSVGEEGTRDLSSDDHVTELGDGEPLVWTLEVYTATTGEKVFSQTVEGSSFTIDTTSWKPGVYVVRAVIGDEVLNEKVVVN